MKKHWFHILLAVGDGRSHGAEIQRRAADRPGGPVKLYPVTLYRSLDEMTTAGLIEEVPEPEDARHNEKRRYYRLTDAGRRALAAEADALETAARMARAVLGSSST